MPTLHISRHGSRQNAKTWANKFRARLLEPGIVSYEDSGCGKALLTQETLSRCMNSFIGRPLILRPNYTHAKVTPRTLEKLANGYISDVKFDESDGWWYAEGTVHDEDAKTAIREVGLVSCAYDVLETGPGGSYHNIPYDEEITAFEGEHLAIVDNPRYEKATIRLNSKSKHNKGNTMFKWIKSKLAPSKQADSQPATKENSVASEEIPSDVALEIDGQEVAVSEVVDAYQKLNSKEGEDISGDSQIEVDGEKITLNALIEAHRLNAKKKNAEDEEDKKENAEEDAEDEKKENASEEDDDKEKKENAEEDEEDKKEKKNSKKVFKVNTKSGPLSQARENGLNSFIETTGRAPDTMEARLNRGNERYGAKK